MAELEAPQAVSEELPVVQGAAPVAEAPTEAQEAVQEGLEALPEARGVLPEATTRQAQEGLTAGCKGEVLSATLSAGLNPAGAYSALAEVQQPAVQAAHRQEVAQNEGMGE